MELRSNRSRSKTPYVMTSFDREVEKIGNHVEERTVTRVTRSSATTKMMSEGIGVGSAEQSYRISDISRPPSSRMRSGKSERTLRSSRFKTSDYSSEDGGEGEISPNKTQDENIRNQLIEEARKRRSVSSSSTSSHISALDVYRAAGEYWNKYPKTDWTYSRNSKDRIEIAPGVIAMPNMSRRSIHRNESNSEYLTTDKQTNTSFMQDEVDESTYTRKSYYSDTADKKIRPRTLFSNNNYKYSSKSSSLQQRNIFYRFLSVFTSIFVTVYSWISSGFYYVYDKHNAGYVWFGKKVHNFAGKIMLFDTWLLRSLVNKKKFSSVLALCLLPLLLLGGWWLLSGLSYTIYNKYLDLTAPVLPSEDLKDYISQSGNYDDSSKNFRREVDNNVDINAIKFENLEAQNHQDYYDSSSTRDRVVTIKEKVIVESPTANEIAASLSEDQLKQISDTIKAKISVESQQNDDVLIEKILHSPAIQNIINNYNNLNVQVNDRSSESFIKHDGEILANQQKIIDELKEEMSKMKLELSLLEKNRNEQIALLMSQLKAENLQNNAKILSELKKCCRYSFIQIEEYVMKILGKLLGAPYHLTNEKDISDWLHSTFVAKQELEARLGNLTENLKSNYDGLIKNNGHYIMDDIMSRLTKELNVRLEKFEGNLHAHEYKGELNVNSITDEYVKKIVQDALAVYDADKTGLVDYALEPSGGQVLSTRCSESYQAGTAVVSVFGIPLWYTSNTPRTVITPGVNPGECWAFQNFPGFLVIKLTGPVKIEAFSYEHISKKLMPDGKINSAPKDFAVYGLRNETDVDPIEIGHYKYNNDGPPLQFFAAEKHGLVFDIIELRVFSNHGNPNYTCLYRFRVHGTLSETPT